MELHEVHRKLLMLEGRVGLRAISVELELLLQLYAHGPLTSSQLLQKMRCSIANFSALKKQLLDCGLIVTERGTTDRRVTYLALSQRVRQSLEAIDKDGQGSGSASEKLALVVVAASGDSPPL